MKNAIHLQCGLAAIDDDPLPVAEWFPALARWVDAPEPPRLSVESTLKMAGEEAVYFHTSLTGVSNSRAKASRHRPFLGGVRHSVTVAGCVFE
jgi:hypothetical protein